ncbi:MAG: hypothetical protein QCI00_05480 [Candidatus Thermoplasmatota archaeon]|nr:hypothetical protein [Candidatus Thermoplasmatota archaeon]
MVKNQNIFISVALAVVIIIAVGIYAYANLFNTDETNQIDDENDINQKNGIPNETHNEIVLTIIHQGVNHTYNLSNLENMGSYTASGRYIKTKVLPDISLGNIYTFTGIPLSTILEDINISSNEYQLDVISTDGWSTTYTMNETLGNVDIYDITGNITDEKSVIMIIAYKENGSYYSEIDPNNEIGPLRIAFVGDNTPITPSGLWAKMVDIVKISYIS